MRRGRRIDHGVLDVAARERDAQLLGLLVGGDAGGVARRDEVAVAHRAARRARALAAREDAQQTGGLAARRRGVLIVVDVDDPGAPADRHAGERHGVASVELALGARIRGKAEDAACHDCENAPTPDQACHHRRGSLRSRGRATVPDATRTEHSKRPGRAGARLGPTWRSQRRIRRLCDAAAARKTGRPRERGNIRRPAWQRSCLRASMGSARGRMSCIPSDEGSARPPRHCPCA